MKLADVIYNLTLTTEEFGSLCDVAPSTIIAIKKHHRDTVRASTAKKILGFLNSPETLAKLRRSEVFLPEELF